MKSKNSLQNLTYFRSGRIHMKRSATFVLMTTSATLFRQKSYKIISVTFVNRGYHYQPLNQSLQIFASQKLPISSREPKWPITPFQFALTQNCSIFVGNVFAFVGFFCANIIFRTRKLPMIQFGCVGHFRPNKSHSTILASDTLTHRLSGLCKC